jgi:hypothetical protein
VSGITHTGDGLSSIEPVGLVPTSIMKRSQQRPSVLTSKPTPQKPSSKPARRKRGWRPWSDFQRGDLLMQRIASKQI